ncbi:MAG: CsgG/HfaB family protein [Campylobacterota bacterium]|nr:CsgG/HfaB family protein [Campylobacterota bacterium]
MRLLFLLFPIVIFFTACSQKVQMRALEPAEVDRAASTKMIAVTAFKNDRIGLSGKIEAILAKQKVDNKSFFTLMSRSDLKKIIQEQKVQNSGLMETSTAVEVGRLMGAQALISGDVGNVGLQDTRFYETRVRCSDKKCKETYTYNVRCTKRVVSLSAELRMVDVTKGDIIYADTLSKNAEWAHCQDDSRAMPSKEMAGQHLANAIAKKFAYKLTPHYRTFEVSLLEDPDLDYTDEQESYLENALLYIEHNRYDKAEKLLIDLIDSTGQQSYVAFYNLGVIKEAQGHYHEAQNYYGIADNLMIEPVDEINAAFLRIQTAIEKRKITQEQMAR